MFFLNSINIISVLIIFFIFSWFLFYKLVSSFKNEWLVYPNSRSSHNLPTPFGGGIIFAIISIFSSIFNHNLSFILSLPVVIAGHVDDYKGVSALKRFLVQLGCSLLLLAYKAKGNFFNSIGFEDLDFLKKLIIILVLMFIYTSLVNISNFSDGLDGLLGGSMLIVFFTLSISLSNQNHLIPLIASLLAFLTWNWYPSKLFMGDSGSYFLGSVYFSSMLDSTSLIEGLSFLFLAFPIYADVSITMLRRLINKQNIFKAHKLFLFQRLHQSGLSHSSVCSLYLFASIFVNLSFVLGGIKYVLISSSLIILLGFFLDQKVAIRFRIKH